MRATEGEPQRMAPPALEERLRCPACGERVTPEAAGYVCRSGHAMAHRVGYVDASASATDQLTSRTLDSFGYQWSAFDTLRPEDQVFWERYFTDVDLDELRQRVGLDAGCGMGRFSRFTAAHLAALVALDGSDAVAVAARHLSELDNVLVVKADLREAPFAPGSFGFVSCLGVLHHLGDPEAGLRALVRLLDRDGILLVFLYSRPRSFGLRWLALAAASWLRRLTVRLPGPLLKAFSAPVAVVLYGAVVTPGRVGEASGWSALSNLPLRAYREQPLHSLWLDTHDRLGAPLERRYSWDDVRPWFDEAGLSVEAVNEDVGLTVVARRRDNGAG